MIRCYASAGDCARISEARSVRDRECKQFDGPGSCLDVQIGDKPPMRACYPDREVCERERDRALRYIAADRVSSCGLSPLPISKEAGQLEMWR